jgi:hypothetical protein
MTGEPPPCIARDDELERDDKLAPSCLAIDGGSVDAWGESEDESSDGLGRLLWFVLVEESKGGGEGTPIGVLISTRLVSSTEVNNGSMWLLFEARWGTGVNRELFEWLPVPFL